MVSQLEHGGDSPGSQLRDVSSPYAASAPVSPPGSYPGVPVVRTTWLPPLHGDVPWDAAVLETGEEAWDSEDSSGGYRPGNRSADDRSLTGQTMVSGDSMAYSADSA